TRSYGDWSSDVCSSDLAQVADVGVIGRPDAVHTEEVIAMIVPVKMPENRQELADALRAFCRQHLAPYEVPQKVEFLDKLPRSARSEERRVGEEWGGGWA